MPPDVVAQVSEGAPEAIASKESSRAVDMAAHSPKMNEMLPNVQNMTARKEIIEAAVEAKRTGDDGLFNRRMEQHAPDQAGSVSWQQIANEYYEQLRLVQEQRVNERAKAGDQEGVKRGTKDVRETIKTQKELGEEKSVHQMEQESLMRIGEDLNDTQKADVLNAALAVGFSAASVYAVGAAWAGIAGEMEGASPADMEMDRQIKQTMERDVEELRKVIDRAKKKEATKQEVDEAERRLARLVGSAHAKEARATLEKQGGEMEKMIEKALAEQLELAKQLHTGHLEAVAPAKKQAMG